MHRVLAAGVLAALLTAALPAAQAHGQTEAAELEWYVIEDEMDDSVYYTGGYDAYQVFVGEAHHPGLGDGVYWRTVLWGDASVGVPEGGDLTATFRFQVGDQTVERTLRTQDGETFESDFDVLRTEVGDGEVEVYGFILGDTLNLTEGSELTGFEVETAYGGDARDVAPGGIYVPGTDGGAEIPMESRGRLVDAAVLEGVDRYLDVGVQNLGENGFLLNVQSQLTEGGQHVTVVPDNQTEGWAMNATSPLSVALEPGAATTFGLNLDPMVAPGETVDPLRIDVLTDVGGRVTLFAVHTDEGVNVVPEDAVSSLESAPLPEVAKEAPAPATVAVLAALAALAVAARRRE